LDRDHGPLLRYRGEPHPEVGELRLQVVLHVVEDARGAAGSRRDVEAVGRETADDAVVHDEAGLAEEEAITATARLQLGPGVGVEAVHEFGGVRPDNLDLAESGGVEDADARPHRLAFAGDRGLHVLAGPREIAGALPLPDVLEDGTRADRPI